MQTDSAEPFSNNWTYLKAELAWLDRVLGLAVARQRKEVKEVDRLARSRADRVTSHWWKGLVTLEGETAYDSPAEMPRHKSPATTSFQQQLEAKIQASQQRGIALGLPMLRTRLQLTSFEKNLVLMALAPEVSRRYGRIYNYLQETDQPGATGLPTVDLVLRILCRNDIEWRSARQCLSTNSALIRHCLLHVEPSQSESLLTRLIKLSDPLVSFLLAEQPDAVALEALLEPLDVSPDLASTRYSKKSSRQSSQSSSLQIWTPPDVSALQSPETAWSKLVLPNSLITSLQHLCHRIQFAHQVDDSWQFQHSTDSLQPGQIVLLTGVTGTGKTTTARTIAQTLQVPLVWVDLAMLNSATYSQLMHDVVEHAPTVLLLKSAQLWLGRSTPLPEPEILQLLAVWRQSSSITLLSVQHKQTIKPRWQQQFSQILEFSKPNQASRLQLWQQAFPSQVPLSPDIDWQELARRFVLTGGEICTIARDAAVLAAASSEQELTMDHLLQACRTLKRRG